MRFYLGTHMPSWLEKLDLPLFVSARRLRKYRRDFPRALAPWALDSGGFTELQKYGRWTVSPEQYVAEVRRFRDEVGNLEWAAPQDWMCEPIVINGGRVNGQTFVGTHLSVAEHQQRTVDNYLRLRDLAPDLPFVPVLQGWELDDYLRHIDAYAAAGVDVRAERLVGIGSVCRRQRTDEIDRIVSLINDGGLRLHGFGVKTGLHAYGHALASADSMAWSFRGRKIHRPGCRLIWTKCHIKKHEPGHCGGRHHTEANCLSFALGWRQRLLSVTPQPAQLAFDWAV